MLACSETATGVTTQITGIGEEGFERLGNDRPGGKNHVS